jgi:hypothetical protein
MLENLPRLSASLHRDNFVTRDKVYVGLRATALVPCFLLCHLDNFIVTRNLLPYPGTGKKHVTATRTPTN